MTRRTKYISLFLFIIGLHILVIVSGIFVYHYPKYAIAEIRRNSIEDTLKRSWEKSLVFRLCSISDGYETSVANYEDMHGNHYSFIEDDEDEEYLF